MIEWSVLQLSPPSSPQNTSSLQKSVLAEFNGLAIHKESMETDRNWIWQCEALTGAVNNRALSGSVDAASQHFTNSSFFKIIWISHEFRIHGIQLVLISGMSFNFVERKRAIIKVLTIQSLYCSFIGFLLTIYLTDHFIYFIDHFIYFTDRLNDSRSKHVTISVFTVERPRYVISSSQ